MKNKSASLLPVSMIAASIFTTGCELTAANLEDIENLFAGGNQDPPKQIDPPNVEPNCFNQRLVQPKATITKKVDLLFVTDTSGSLYSERGEIADGIEAFLNALPGDVDINIGLLLGHGSQSQHAGKLYRKHAYNPHVLKSTELTNAQIRSKLRTRLMQTPGDWTTDGGEAGLYAVDYALTGDNLQTLQNQGMIREDAALAVIFIADENAICARYPQGVNRVYDPDQLEIPAFNYYCPGVTHETVVDLLRNLKGDKPLLVGGIVYSDQEGYPQGGENEYGWGYMEAIERANGVAINLANGHYEQGLAEIGRLTTLKLNLITEMLLAHTNVNETTIEVTVDGATAPFTYNSSTNILNLPEPGGAQSVVDVNYCLNPNGSGGCTGLSCGGGIGV